MCCLRGVKIDLVPWTTCRNHRYKSKNFPPSAVEPAGPLYAIVCEVKDNTGGYEMIPYFNGIRVDTVQMGGGDTIVGFTDSEGVRREFSSVEDYLSFYEQSEQH